MNQSTLTVEAGERTLALRAPPARLIVNDDDGYEDSACGPDGKRDELYDGGGGHKATSSTFG